MNSGPRLRRLTLDGSSPDLGDIALILVGRHCPKLLQFKLYSTASDSTKVNRHGESQSCRSRVTDFGLIALAKGCHSLQSLNLVACSEVAALECAKVLPHLRSLSLIGSSVVTDRVLTTIVHTCPRLHRLFLSASGQGNLTLAGVLSLGHAACLNFLHVGSPCVIINTTRDAADAAVAAIVLACPRLVKLSLRVMYWQLECSRPRRRPSRSACESGAGCHLQEREITYTRQGFLYILPTASHERSRFRERAAALFSQSHGMMLPDHPLRADVSPSLINVHCRRDKYRALCDDLALSHAHLAGSFCLPRQDSPATAMTTISADTWVELWSSISSPNAKLALFTTPTFPSQVLQSHAWRLTRDDLS